MLGGGGGGGAGNSHNNSNKEKDTRYKHLFFFLSLSQFFVCLLLFCLFYCCVCGVGGGVFFFFSFYMEDWLLRAKIVIFVYLWNTDWCRWFQVRCEVSGQPSHHAVGLRTDSGRGNSQAVRGSASRCVHGCVVVIGLAVGETAGWWVRERASSVSSTSSLYSYTVQWGYQQRAVRLLEVRSGWRACMIVGVGWGGGVGIERTQLDGEGEGQARSPFSFLAMLWGTSTDISCCNSQASLGSLSWCVYHGVGVGMGWPGQVCGEDSVPQSCTVYNVCMACSVIYNFQSLFDMH